MRPQEINRNIDLAFKRFARDGNLIHFQKCKKHLLKRLEWFRKNEPELDCGFPNYMYCFEDEYNEEDIKHHLSYISDRWNCPGRIKFMLKVINRGL
jgi:hypothetical protein